MIGSDQTILFRRRLAVERLAVVRQLAMSRFLRGSSHARWRGVGGTVTVSAAPTDVPPYVAVRSGNVAAHFHASPR